ncbi:hypothetical protein, partial [Streptomyces sp. WM6378]|uniref:hypothetical protein n=1 Tax=Streptomyces sp. WM6378 TaxID=1415557 RepID=UPI001F2AAA64
MLQVEGHVRVRDGQDPQAQLRHPHGEFGEIGMDHYMRLKPPEGGENRGSGRDSVNRRVAVRLRERFLRGLPCHGGYRDRG